MKFFVTFFITFLMLIGIYLATYRVVDPKGEHGSGAFPQPFANSRVKKQALFKEFAKAGPLDGIILGSSRSMVLDPAIAQEELGLRVFNFSVESAMAEDYLAIYRWAKLQGAKPKVLFVGLDVEALHNKLKRDLRLDAEGTLRRAVANDLQAPDLKEKAEDALILANSALTAQSAIAMAQGVMLKVRPQPQVDVVQPDGHTEYPVYLKDKAAGKWDLPKRISMLVPAYFNQYETMTALSPERVQYVRDLIEEALKDGVEIVFWIPPLHPKMIEAIGTDTFYFARLKDLLAMESEIENGAHFRLEDLSSLDKFGGNPDDFRDGAHMDHKNAELVFKKILQTYKEMARL